MYKDLKNTDWEQWTNRISNQITEHIGDNLEDHNDARTLWNTLRKIITDANDQIMTKICVTSHSKPFWEPEITKLSQKLRRANAKYDAKSTPSNKLI